MSNKIKLKRGLSSNISSVVLDDGEVALTTDTNKLYSKKGEIAPNNVYIGTSEPSDNNIECWINPDGQSGSEGEGILGEILFENETGVGTNITLAKSVTNYKYIEIFYKDNNGIYSGYTKVYQPNNKHVDISMTEANGKNSGYIRRARYLVSDTSMSLINKGYINFSGSSISYNTATNYLYITRVVGYKLSVFPNETQPNEIILYSNKIYSDTEINLNTNEYKRLLITCAVYDSSNINTGGASNVIMLDLEAKGTGTTNYVATNSFAYVSSDFTTANALMQIAIVVNADKTTFKPVFFYNTKKITSDQTNYYVSKIVGIKK